VGAKIELRTNSEHVYEFWKLNWFLTDEGEPDGIIYVVNGIEGYAPHLYYNLKKERFS